VIFYDLLCEDLCAQQVGEGFQETAKPISRLVPQKNAAGFATCGAGDQDEKPDEGSHAYSPFVDGLNPSRGMT
jgi:hypothetical protein